LKRQFFNYIHTADQHPALMTNSQETCASHWYDLIRFGAKDGSNVGCAAFQSGSCGTILWSSGRVWCDNYLPGRCSGSNANSVAGTLTHSNSDSHSDPVTNANPVPDSDSVTDAHAVTNSDPQAYGKPVYLRHSRL
jgi:hypothetical protein